MKIHASLTSLALSGAAAVCALLPASRVLAQDLSLRVNIPFEFQDATHTLPAGRYLIQARGDNMIALRNTVDKQTALLMTFGQQRSEPLRSGQLVFHRYGNRCFLSEIWRAGDNSGRKLVMSQAEKHLRRSLVARQPAAGTEIALNVVQP